MNGHGAVMKLRLCLEGRHKYCPSKKKWKSKSGAVRKRIEDLYFINT
jgi:hypothetical protein